MGSLVTIGKTTKSLLNIYILIFKTAENLEKKEPKVPLRDFEKHFMKLNHSIFENVPILPTQTH